MGRLHEEPQKPWTWKQVSEKEGHTCTIGQGPRRDALTQKGVQAAFKNKIPHPFFPLNLSNPDFWGTACGKESACPCRRHKKHGFDPWVGKIPWRRAKQPTPVFLPGKSHGRRSLVGCSLWGRRELDMTERPSSNLPKWEENLRFTGRWSPNSFPRGCSRLDAHLQFFLLSSPAGTKEDLPPCQQGWVPWEPSGNLTV